MDFRKATLKYWEGSLPELGHHLRTKRGTTYTVIGVKPNRRPLPKSVAKLELLKLSEEESQRLAPDAIIHTFIWSSRSRKQS